MRGNRTKYPRTPHLAWSGSRDSDDLITAGVSGWENIEYMITEKMDGGGVTLYRDFLHARSLDTATGEEYARVKQFHSAIQWEIPVGWRICGENMAAQHSIRYTHLQSYFYVFSVWDERNVCLSWDDTLRWCDLLKLTPAPQIYRGPFTESAARRAFEIYLQSQTDPVEGYVCRPARAFDYAEFGEVCAKFVRPNHNKTDNSWRTQERVWNEIVPQTNR